MSSHEMVASDVVALFGCFSSCEKLFLSRFEFRDCKPAPMPYDPSMFLRKKSKKSEGSIGFNLDLAYF